MVPAAECGGDGMGVIPVKESVSCLAHARYPITDDDSGDDSDDGTGHIRFWGHWNQGEAEFPGCPVVKAPCFHCWGQGFIKELRSHKLHGKQKKKTARKSISCLQPSIKHPWDVQAVVEWRAYWTSDGISDKGIPWPCVHVRASLLEYHSQPLG